MEPFMAQAGTAMFAEPGVAFAGAAHQDLAAGGPAFQGDLSWNAGGIDAADQFQFENAMALEGPQAMAFPSHGGPSALDSAAPASATLGDAILDRLESLKHRGQAMQAEIVQTLGKDDLKPSDMLRVQYQLMSISVEIQTTSNMAHHGVEDVKTVMRGQ